MIEEISIDKLGQYADAFPGPQAALAVASLAAGNTAGQLWKVGQRSDGDLLFLWDKGNNVFYLAGHLASEIAQNRLSSFIRTQIRPQAVVEGLARFKVRPMTQALAAITPLLFTDTSLKEHPSFFYGFEQAQPNVTKTPAVVGMVLTTIDRHLLSQAHLKNIDEVRGEIAWMWPTLECFYERGLGVAALAGEQIICWCTAEYVGPATCGIGITTIPLYEGRGVATVTAARFVEESLRRRLKPHWECACWNAASARVAEKTGFTRLETVRYWMGTFQS